MSSVTGPCRKALREAGVAQPTRAQLGWIQPLAGSGMLPGLLPACLWRRRRGAKARQKWPGRIKTSWHKQQQHRLCPALPAQLHNQTATGAHPGICSPFSLFNPANKWLMQLREVGRASVPSCAGGGLGLAQQHSEMASDLYLPNRGVSSLPSGVCLPCLCNGIGCHGTWGGDFSAPF